MRRMIIAVSALAVIAGASACGANTNSQGYRDGYSLGSQDGIGLTDNPPPANTCQGVVNSGLAWPSGGIPGDNQGDFTAGFMAACLKADGGH